MADYTIGGLAKQAGVIVETVRYYQRRGLLREPKRPQGGVRHYEDRDVERLRFIKTAQSLGFGLDDVGRLLLLADGANCNTARSIAEQKLRVVRERIEKLQVVETVLEKLVIDCKKRGKPGCCPIISAIAEKSN